MRWVSGSIRCRWSRPPTWQRKGRPAPDRAGAAAPTRQHLRPQRRPPGDDRRSRKHLRQARRANRAAVRRPTGGGLLGSMQPSSWPTSIRAPVLSTFVARLSLTLPNRFSRSVYPVCTPTRKQSGFIPLAASRLRWSDLSTSMGSGARASSTSLRRPCAAFPAPLPTSRPPMASQFPGHRRARLRPCQ